MIGSGVLCAIYFAVTVSQVRSIADKRPQFVIEPPTRVLWPTTRGAHAVCRATGHPAPEIHWLTSEGQLLTTLPGLRHVLNDGRLVLGARRSLLDASGSLLRCRAANRAGVVLSRPVLLQPVDDSALFHTVRQLTPAKVASNLVLKCELSPQIGIVDVRWFQNGLPLPLGFSVSDSRWTSGAGGLLLGTDINSSDLQAEYTCVIHDMPSTPLKLTRDDSSWLENIELTTLEAQEGDTVVLPCIQRYVSLQTVIWQRQDASGSWALATSNDALVRGGALVYSSVRLHHAGRYACSGGNEAVPRILIRLVIFDPISVKISPNPLLIGSGGTGNFNCSVTGGRGNGVTISWQHEGRSLHAQHSRLSLGPIRSHHAGLYQCTAFDHMETSVAQAELVIADRPAQLVSTFTDAVARSGQSVALRCSATGIPPPRIMWTLDDRPLPAAPDKYSVTTRAETSPNEDNSKIVSTLSITIRSADEGGRYGCNATNSKGSQSHHARLNVFGPPNIRYLPPMHVKAETDVTLYCPYSGYPIKEVTWKKEDGTPLESSEVREQNDLLRLTAIRSTATGGYICEVRAESGELARRTVRIEVHKPPKIVPFNFPEEVEIGGSTQATCSLVSGDKPIQFIWLKDNLPIPPTLKIEQKNMDFFSLLIIQELGSAHSGEYTCKASNDFGFITHIATLLVKEPPTWVWRSQNTSISAGAALLLPCSAKGQPVPRISWEYSTDGDNWRHILWGQVDLADTSSGSILADGTVWLRTTTSQHEGWYRCVARATHGAIHHMFYLDVREPPQLSRPGESGETQWVVRGATARLSCTIRGESEMHVHWTHDSRPLSLHGAGGIETRETSGGALLSEMTINHAGPENAGEYKCHARNMYGSDELLFKLFVKERPNVPEEVRISEIWSRRARITWRVTRGAMVAHYTIQYKELTREHTVPLDTLPTLIEDWNVPGVSNLSLANSDLINIPSEGPGRAGTIISELAPDTRYALRVAAFNDVGFSTYTTPLHFTTREEAPGGVPRDITVRALRLRELHVTWQPPPRETWHGTLLGYTIRWWEIPEDGETNLKDLPGTENGASADATSSTIRGLKSAARYAVTVRAYNAAGTGPASPPHYRHTLESPPTGGPESLSCLAGSSTSLKVSWQPPAIEDRGGHITHYTLQYTRRDADPLFPIQDAFLRVQGEDATVSRLSPYAEYEIRVRAHNAAGDGPLSVPQVCRTNEDVPSAPGGIKLVALSERSLRASWLPPPEPNGKLTHYTLHVKELYGSQDTNVTRVNTCEGENGSIECMRSLRGLRPGRTYEAWVKAATIVGDGPTTVAVACMTSALAPARISSFGGISVGSAGASLILRCVVGGAPPPSKRWLRGGMPLLARPPFHLDGDALQIRSLELSHADNYTCLAENPHGSDSTTWKVVVLKPPMPPSIALLESRPRELELELRPAPRALGHAISRTFTLHWRLTAPEGEWRVQAASPGPVALSGLRCGSAYRVYASTGGTQGPELAVRTSGGPPTAPPDTRWIHANATHAKFDTAVWLDGGCGPVALRLEWAGAGSVGARDVPIGGDVILGGLSPASRYRVAARASNEAGWTREVYEFSTSPTEGSLASEVDAPFPANASELAVLLALCAALSLAALTILAILLRRKRGDGIPTREISSIDKQNCGTYRAQSHQPPKLPPDPPEVYEISPYATFAGPPTSASSRAYTLQLRALARHDDDAAPPSLTSCCDEETCVDACDAQRRRRRRRHYCPDHGCSQDSGS